MRRVYNTVSIVLLFLLIAEITYSQINYGNSIKGIVVDKATNKPIAGCEFYLSQTSYFCVTDANGAFEIKNIIPGSYTPVFGCKNYSPLIINMLIDKEQQYTLNGTLEALSPDQLTKFNAPKTSDFKSDYEKFERIFIGNTAYMGSCKAENPEAMFFKWDKDVIEGNSNGSLTFIHKKFGYKLHCFVNGFSYDTKQLGKYLDFTLYFEEMIPKDEDEKEEWADYRKEAYKGSLHHFLWTLRNEKLKDQDFEVFTLRSLGNEAFTSDGMDDASSASNQFQNKVLSFSEIQLGKVDESQIMFSISGFLKVVYKPRSYSKETSFLQVPSGATMTLDKEGWTDIDMPFVFYGLWAKNGISNMLPKEYRAKNQ